MFYHVSLKKNTQQNLFTQCLFRYLSRYCGLCTAEMTKCQTIENGMKTWLFSHTDVLKFLRNIIAADDSLWCNHSVNM